MDLKNCYHQMQGILGPEYQEPFEVVKAIEEYRQYWKPKKVKIILLAESHVYTTLEDFQDICETPSSALPNYPKNYVRFIYCINYGANSTGQRNSRNKWGTPQFWKIFYSTLNHITKNSDFGPTKNFDYKLKILKEMKEKGIWLVDASISGLYIPGGSKPKPKILKESIACSWEGFVKNVVEECLPEKLIVIGKTVWNTIHPLLSPKLKDRAYWVYQPNAHLSSEEHMNNFQKLYRLCN